ncbi:MAG: tetratricopeptide repeat protein [Myxococcales bacterium]|nr:tetratricopeptide repeat protein [Myxococcales bacterium]
MRRVMFLCCLLGCLLGSVAVAAAQASDPLAEGKAAYEALDFEKALLLLQQAVGMPSRYTPGELAEAHRYLAMTLLAYNRADEAREQFVQALRANPDLAFDPDLTSPKILQAFAEAKRIFEEKYARPAAKNEPLPTGHTWRWPTGWTLIGIGGACLATSGVTYGLVWDTYGKYQAEDEDQDKLDRLKKQGETYEAVSGVSLGVGAVLTGLGIYFAATDHPRPVHESSLWPPLVSPLGPAGTTGLTMGWRFQ